MYRVELTDEQRRELTRRLRTPGLAPRTRERLEMARLSDAGWSVPRIAAHVRQHGQTVRRWIKAYLAGGFDALGDRPHRGQKSAATEETLAQVRAWLEKGDRAYTSGQIAEEAAARLGVRLGPAQWRRLLRRAGQSYTRTKRSLGHKQDAAEVAGKAAELDALKKGRTRAG